MTWLRAACVVYVMLVVIVSVLAFAEARRVKEPKIYWGMVGYLIVCAIAIWGLIR